MNVERLRRVGDALGQLGRPFNMMQWCGCIVGHTELVALRDHLPYQADTLTDLYIESKPRRACRFLGLSGDQGEYLFHVPNWPASLRDRYYDAATQVELVQAAQAAIEWLIQTHALEAEVNAVPMDTLCEMASTA